MKYLLMRLAAVFLLSISVLFAQAEPPSEKLLFSHRRGFYREPVTLTITTQSGKAEIRCTMDGTDPASSATAIKGAPSLVVPIDPADVSRHDRAPGVCVRAAAVNNGTVTAKETHTYLFVERAAELSPENLPPGPDWPPQSMTGDLQWLNYGLDPQVYNSTLYRDKFVRALTDIPSMSVVMDLRDLFNPKRGIYVNAGQHGIAWERPCSLELLLPDGEEGFQIDAGIRIRGGYSRSNQNPKHAFRFFFRSEYGNGKLKYPLFGDEGVDEFDAFDLRTSQNYSWAFDGSDQNTMNRDVFSRDAQRDMGQPYTRSRYYHLYINGTYWGLYQTQERSEASFAASYFGGSPEDYDVIKVAADQGYVIEATDGNLDAWRKLWETARNGFLTDSAYYYIQGKNPDGSDNPALPVLLDIDNLIDYLLITYYTGNLDAPVSNFLNNTSPNNFYALRNRNGRQGFVFFQHDSEHTLLDPNVDRTGPFSAGNTFDKSNPQYLHQRLMEHPHYRVRFADHVRRHFFGTGALTPAVNIRRFLARKQEIDLAIIAESARWGNSKRSVAFTRDREWAAAIDRVVKQFMPGRTQTVLNQFIKKGWYPQTAPPRFNAAGGLVPAGFRLSLSAPAGEVYYTTDGSDPYLPNTQVGEFKTLVPETAPKYVFVPTQTMDFNWRRPVTYDFSSWIFGSGGVGYERDNGYQKDIQIDVGDRMYNKQTSCYIRIPFNVNKSEIQDFNVLHFKVKYDDGFIIYLNGWRTVEALAPETPAWNAHATGLHESEGWEVLDASPEIGRLKEGENFLAVHALNASANSSDFLFSVELVAGKVINQGRPSPTAILYREPLSLERTTRVRARVRSGADWSAAADETFYVLNGLENLRVTEIHYHPLESHPGAADDDRFEFIELKNIGQERLDLSGCSFVRGVQNRFAQGTTLEAKGFIVIAADSAAFRERYGFYPHGLFVGRLDNGGERLLFVDAEDDTLFSLSYGDRRPWPRSADGQGFSLTSAVIEPCMDQNDAKLWRASTEIHGTPGRDDYAAAAVEAEPPAERPSRFHLAAAYPNPFNEQTTLSFELPRSCRARIDVFNIRGQLAATLLDARLEAGRHAVSWNAAEFASGIYFCRLSADGFVLTRKVTLIR